MKTLAFDVTLKTLAFDVTQEDIDKAMARPVFRGAWATCCPIAEALHRQGYEDVDVLPYSIWVEGQKFEIQEGSEIYKYIQNIDRTHNTIWKEKHPEIELEPIVPKHFFLDQDDDE